MPPSFPKAVLFDLDGTLLDSAPDMLAAINALRDGRGHAPMLLAELRPQEQRYWRLVAERKGQVDARMQELRWLLEELRVSFFAQELRTPQPVSVKRLEKLWAQINS